MMCVTGWWLELRLGPTLFGRKVTVYTNLPEEGRAFSRKQYRALTWSSVANDDTAKYCRLLLTTPGSYHYYFHYDDRWVKIYKFFFLPMVENYCERMNGKIYYF